MPRIVSLLDAQGIKREKSVSGRAEERIHKPLQGTCASARLLCVGFCSRYTDNALPKRAVTGLIALSEDDYVRASIFMSCFLSVAWQYAQRRPSNA